MLNWKAGILPSAFRKALCVVMSLALVWGCGPSFSAWAWEGAGSIAANYSAASEPGSSPESAGEGDDFGDDEPVQLLSTGGGEELEDPGLSVGDFKFDDVNGNFYVATSGRAQVAFADGYIGQISVVSSDASAFTASYDSESRMITVTGFSPSAVEGTVTVTASACDGFGESTAKVAIPRVNKGIAAPQVAEVGVAGALSSVGIKEGEEKKFTVTTISDGLLSVDDSYDHEYLQVDFDNDTRVLTVKALAVGSATIAVRTAGTALFMERTAFLNVTILPREVATLTVHANYPDWQEDSEEVVVRFDNSEGGARNVMRSDLFDPPADGYQCNGFTYDREGKQQAEGIYRSWNYPGSEASSTRWFLPESDTEIYAQWEKVFCVLTFGNIYRGGQSVDIVYQGAYGDPVVDADGHVLTSLPDPGMREGYAFGGWLYGAGDIGQAEGPYTADELLAKHPLDTFDKDGLLIHVYWKPSTEGDEQDTPTGHGSDLYKMLTDESGQPRSGQVELENQGSYYLSKSVEGFTGSLVIDKKGSYDIDLRGNSITFGAVAATSIGGWSLVIGSQRQGNTVSDVSDVDVNITSTVGRGCLSFLNGGRTVVYGDGSLHMRGVDVTKSFTLDDQVSEYTVPAIEVPSPSAILDLSRYRKTQVIELSDCAVSVDVSNQKKGGATGLSVKNAQVGVSITSFNLKSALIEGSTISVSTGTPEKSSGSQGSVDAVGLLVRAASEGPVTVKGSKVSAVASQGSAYAVYRYHYYRCAADEEAAVVLDGTTLEASGGGEGAQLSVGALNTLAPYAASGYTAENSYGSPMTLAGRISFASSAKSGAYALATDVRPTSAGQAAFALDESFASGEPLTFVAGLDYQIEKASYNGAGDLYPIKPAAVDGAVNAAGTYVASCAADASEEWQSAAAALIENGVLGSKAYVAPSPGGLVLVVDEADAEARLVRDGDEVAFGAFEDMAVRMQDGDELVVVRDLNRAVIFSETDAEKADGADASSMTFAVNLAGHVIGRLENGSSANVSVRTTAGSQPPIPGVEERVDRSDKQSQPVLAGVVQNGSGVLELDGVGVRIVGGGIGCESVAGAMVNAGTLKLKGATIDVAHAAQSVTRTVVGVWVRGGALEADESSSVQARSASSVKLLAAVTATGASSMRLGGCDIEASGAAERVCAVNLEAGEPNGKIDAALDGARASSQVAGEAGSSYGVYASGDASVSLSAAVVSAGCAVGEAIGRAWALYAADASGQGASPSFALSGAAKISTDGGAARVRLAAEPLSLAEDFEMGAGPAVVIKSDRMSDDVFAVPAADETDGEAHLSSLAGLFVASDDDDSYYAGWQAEASGDSLRWNTDSVARVGSELYNSLAAAIAAAGDGGEVVVVKDFKTTAFTISRTVAIDLAGCTVTVNSPAASAIGVAAGRLTLKDSGAADEDAPKGALRIASRYAGASASACGISVSGNGALTVDGAKIVAYPASASAADAFSAVNVAAAIAAQDELPIVEVKNGAEVVAGSTPESVGVTLGASSALSGPQTVYGVRNACTVAGAVAVSVDEKSTVRAATALPMRQAGAIVSDASNLTGTESPLSSANLREFDPESDPALYDAICAQFKLSAKYDKTATSGYEGAAYGSQIYYASPMRLPDGTYVWAFSDVVSGDDVGDESLIVPSKIYLQSTYEVTSDAVGVGADGASAASVEVKGRVEASSLHGSACAVAAAGKGTWSIDGAKVAASGSDERYLARTGTWPDVKGALGLGSVVTGFFPKNNTSVSEVRSTMPAAAGVRAASDDVAVELAGNASFQVTGGQAVDVESGDVTVAAGFAASPALAIRAASGNAAGATFAKAAGEDELAEMQRASFADADGDLVPELSDDGKSLAWAATYLVRFVDAYGAEVLAYERVAAGDELSLPDEESVARAATATRSYTLYGWSAFPSASPGSDDVVAQAAADGKWAFAIPSGGAVDGVVTMHPVYEEGPVGVQVVFAGALSSSGEVKDNVIVNASAGVPLGDKASEVPAGYAEDFGGNVFVGWEAAVPRATNDNITGNSRLRTVDPACVSSITAATDVVYAAKYVNVAAGQQLVSFKVDDWVYAYAVDDGALPTFADAMKASTGEELVSALQRGPVKQQSGMNWKFAGWHEGKSDDRYPNAEIEPSELLAYAEAEGGRRDYTAVFESEGVSPVSITLHYFGNWGTGASESWKYNVDGALSNTEQQRFSVPYGFDVSQIVPGKDLSKLADSLKNVNIVDYVEQSGDTWRSHRFLGWSVRSTDKEPLSAEVLPKAGSGSSAGGVAGSTTYDYYAIYSDEEMETDVAFYSGGTRLASAVVPTAGTLSDALAAAVPESSGSLASDGAVADEAPAVRRGAAALEEAAVALAPAHMRFSGWWASKAGGDAITSPDLSLITNAGFEAPKNGDGSTRGSAAYYAVYESAADRPVTLHANGASNWTSDWSGLAEPGEPLSITGYVTPYRYGYAFLGWNTDKNGMGSRFDLGSSTVTGDSLELWANFVPLESASSKRLGFDLSKARLRLPDGLRATNVTLVVEEREDAEDYDGIITIGTSDRALTSFKMSVLAQVGNRTVDVTDELEGTVSLNLPVPEGYPSGDGSFLVYFAGRENPVSASLAGGTSSSEATAQLDGSSGSSGGELAVQGDSTDGADNQAVDGGNAVAVASASGGFSSSNTGNVVLVYRMSSDEWRLAMAKENAKTQLKAIYDSYNEGDFTPENWEALAWEWAKGNAAIDAAGSINEVQAAAQAASDAMANVPTTAGVDTAKAESLVRLAEAYGGYTKSDYSEATWDALVAAYTAAKDAILSATTAKDARKAASDGILAMAAFSPDAPSDDSTNSGTAGTDGSDSPGKSGKGKDADGDGKTDGEGNGEEGDDGDGGDSDETGSSLDETSSGGSGLGALGAPAASSSTGVSGLLNTAGLSSSGLDSLLDTAGLMDDGGSNDLVPLGSASDDFLDDSWLGDDVGEEHGWVKTAAMPTILVLSLAMLATAALVWWLMRRRNFGYEDGDFEAYDGYDGDDFEDEDADFWDDPME